MRISLDKAETRYKQELEKGLINTENKPHYNSFSQYCNMLRDSGYEVEE